jgi:hypothetical protein
MNAGGVKNAEAQGFPEAETLPKAKEFRHSGK